MLAALSPGVAGPFFAAETAFANAFLREPTHPDPETPR